MTPQQPRIFLSIRRADGSGLEVEGIVVTPIMMEAAEALHDTLLTGERVLPKDLYDVIAIAFATTREDAKARLLRALYSKKDAP